MTPEERARQIAENNLDDRIREWSGRDQVQQVFVNGYITNNTGAASAINEAMELLAAVQAKNKRLRETLQRLADCEAEYRQLHDLRGGSDMLTGHAWDHMRHAGDDARAALKETGDD